jgi:Ca-dependent carbohydrate-binding module xylan-binding
LTGTPEFASVVYSHWTNVGLSDTPAPSLVLPAPVINDLYGGSATTDRNLYLDSATYDGVAQAGGTLALMAPGTQSFQASTPDTLALHVAETAYLGDAQFTVAVDGKQGGSTYTATASHTAGQSQEIDIGGDWGKGSHTVSINFLNDLYAGTPATDRNLYVTGASYDGTVQQGASLLLASSGAKSFKAVSSTTYNEGSAGGTVTTLGNDIVQIGSGAVTINANGPSVDIIGAAGSMKFIASAGNDTVTAGSGASTITGGSGTLSFTAGAGNATIAAGIGKEVLDLINGTAGGSLTISGFNSGTDVIHLEGYSGTGVRTDTVTNGSTQIVLTEGIKINPTGFVGGSSHPIFG